MPTECERHNVTHVQQTQQQQQQQQQQQTQLQQQQPNDAAEQNQQQQLQEPQRHPDTTTLSYDAMELSKELNGEMSTSQTSNTSSASGGNATNGHNGNTNGIGGRKTSITSPDPTAYVAKARITRPTPPPPSNNPMQFVQIKPCNLYQTAQEQLKKAEEVKKIKEIKKEEPEDWQNNLDNWKSSRRKRVEHIIDRVVEVKKLELEEHDRSRRKSKTFSEMIEERGERGARGRTKLASLAVYNEDESNDLSDLGIGTSSASGKSSQSEDYDNNSVLSDNAELDKAIFEQNHKPSSLIAREYISSPGYDTSSSTAPGSSPDPCEYTYEGAIQDYKQRVSRASAGNAIANYKLNSGANTNANINVNAANNNNNNSVLAKSTASPTKETPVADITSSSETYPTRRGSKIEDRLIGFEVTSPSDSQEGVEKNKVDVPKIDISKRKEIFENQNTNSNSTEPKSAPGGANANGHSHVAVPRVTLRDRFKVDESVLAGNGEIHDSTLKREVKRLSGDITSIRDRMQSLEQQQNLVNATHSSVKGSNAKLVDIPVPPLKERLSSLQNAVAKEEIKKPPVVLVDARQLEIMKTEEETAKQRMKQLDSQDKPAPAQPSVVAQQPAPVTAELDRDDSGIHTADDNETEEHISEQEQQLNAAIAALALEEQQLTEAANAVNQIEAEFAELSSSGVNGIKSGLTPATTASTNKSSNEPQSEMEFSVSLTNKNSSLLDPSYSSGKSSNDSCISNEINGSRSAGDEVDRSVPLNNTTHTLLQRKPSNEMVHARNLLRMFKETFKNDIELDEELEQQVEPQACTGAIPKAGKVNSVKTHKFSDPNDTQQPTFASQSTQTPLNTPIATQVFQTSNKSPLSRPIIAQKPPSPSLIPRSINPTGKPPISPSSPMSPKSARYCASSKFSVSSPITSPIATRRSMPENNQFSINGRVEIFNSKNISDIGKPPTPTMCTRKAFLPQVNNTTPAAAAAKPLSEPTTPTMPTTVNAHSNIGFPKQQDNHHQAQRHSPTVTTLSATTEALSISNQTLPAATAGAGAKSMPGADTVNEPTRETRISNGSGATTVHTTQQQQQKAEQPQPQQRDPDVVICAPPVTILNPDELPKPNTVKALSSCFVEEATNQRNVTPTSPTVPKPIPRSVIQTPPQSPTTSKRNCNDSQQSPQSAPKSNLQLQNGTKLQLETKPTESAAKAAAELRSTATRTITEREVVFKSTDGASDASASGDTDRSSWKTLSTISNATVLSTSSNAPGGPIETVAQVHSPPESLEQQHKSLPKSVRPLKLTSKSEAVVDPLQPNATLSAVVTSPSPIPDLVSCERNKSTLFKLATPPSTPQPPLSPTVTEICEDFLNSFKATEAFAPHSPVENQQCVLESPCDKVDVHDLPPNKQPPCTFYKDISAATLEQCDNCGAQRKVVLPQRQHTVEDKPCQKLDVSELPPADQVPCTSFDEITAAEVRRCDGLNASKPNTVTVPKADEKNAPPAAQIKLNTKHSSPIMAVRAAHSIALIETCERIIAEERHHSNQLKNSLPVVRTNKVSTPQAARRTKIPKPIPCCIGGSDSKNKAEQEADIGDAQTNELTEADGSIDDSMVIGRLHMMETQIKVTTTTPPTTPKASNKASHTNAKENSKKTKNIFDFLRKNFGMSESEHSTEQEKSTTATPAKSTSPAASVTAASNTTNKNNLTLNFDNITTIDNSKFYVPYGVDDYEEPPPLPKTPAPVKIEITKTITTDEIMEDGNNEQELVQEINDMLDDELNKLSVEYENVRKAPIVKE